MDDHRPGVGRRRGFDTPQEGQQACSVIRHSVFWPGCEVELTHLVLGWISSLEEESKHKHLRVFYTIDGKSVRVMHCVRGEESLKTRNSMHLTY